MVRSTCLGCALVVIAAAACSPGGADTAPDTTAQGHGGASATSSSTFVPPPPPSQTVVTVASSSSGSGGFDEATSSVTVTASVGAGGALVESGGGGAYPAPHDAIPQIVDGPVPVLDAPALVTITFQDDPLAEDMQTFGAAVPTLGWWTTVFDGYGVGAGTNGAVRVAEDAPTTVEQDDVPNWISAHVASGVLPPPTAETIYMVYYPDTTAVNYPWGPCTYGGYHDSMMLDVAGQATPVAYAVIERCGDEAWTTMVSGHEIAEAATDPQVYEGYYAFESGPWWPASFGGSEVADLCESDDAIVDSGFSLPRVWSNGAAARGAEPCVPVPPDEAATPYFNVSLPAGIFGMQAGQTMQVEARCYSFGPLSSPMTLRVPSGGPPYAAVTPTTCNNGDVVTLMLGAPELSPQGYAYFDIEAVLDDGTAHTWPFWIEVEP